jgi:hypothetical protein
MIMKKILLYSIILFTLIAPLYVGATVTVTGGGTDTTGSPSVPFKIINPIRGADTLDQLIVLLLQNVVTPLLAVFVFLAIMYAGFKFVIAQGNPSKINEAKQGILWAMIGAGIMLGATGIAEVIKATFGSIVN